MFNRILSFFVSLLILISDSFGIGSWFYSSKELFADPEFNSGFTVLSLEKNGNDGIAMGSFVYSDRAENPPAWMIAQWNSKHCLWNERIEADKYTLTDGITKCVTYCPDDKSLSMRLNAANVYNGNPAGNDNWPHLLIEQSPIVGYRSMSDGEKLFYRCDSERIVLSLDIRIKDFKDTTNPDGVNACQYLAYFYLRGINSQDFIWFGVNLFDSRGLQDSYWSIDTAGSNNMIYTVSTADTFGSARSSLFRNNKPYVNDEWTHIELDLTEHLDDMIKEANASGLYETKLSREDLYIGGTNIGFEIHGNYDCTVDIKGFQLTSYRIKARG